LEKERLRVAGDYVITNLGGVYQGSVKASSELAGGQIFISPTGSTVAAITKTFGKNIREEKVKEYNYSQLLRAKSVKLNRPYANNLNILSPLGLNAGLEIVLYASPNMFGTTLI